MESRMVVALAGRCAEHLILGEAYVSTAGAADLELANSVAREMVYRCGFGRRTGPVALMDNEEVYLNKDRTRRVADISTEMAKIAYTDIKELMEGAEAKAYWALASNYKALQALAKKLYEVQTMNGEEVKEIIESCDPKKFEGPYVIGFSWSDDGELVWPGKEPTSSSAPSTNGSEKETVPSWWSPRNPYMVRTDIADILSES